MRGSVSYFVDKEKLTELIPKAEKRYDSEIGQESEKKTQLMFDMQREVTAEDIEISDESISFHLDTPFGDVHVYLTPDREFLAGVTEVAVARVNKAIAVLENGNIRA